MKLKLYNSLWRDLINKYTTKELPLKESWNKEDVNNQPNDDIFIQKSKNFL